MSVQVKIRVMVVVALIVALCLGAAATLHTGHGNGLGKVAHGAHAAMRKGPELAIHMHR